jgi:putative oxidoreductase
MSWIFVSSGWGKMSHFAGTAAKIASRGVPLPEIATVIAIAIELGGGLLLIAGWKARWAALAMAVFTVAAAIFFHNFWAAPPEQVVNQTIHFWKNIAMTGGLLFVFAYGSGPFSLERQDGR